MNNRTMLVTAVLAWLCCAAVPAQEPAPDAGVELKVLTWNIQMLPTLLASFDDRLSKMQAQRVPWVIEHLNQCDYDILCLQEVMDPAAQKALEEGLKAEYPYTVPPQFAEGRAFSNGVLFMSRVPIHYVAHVVFDDLTRIELFTSKGCCLIEGEKGGVTFQLAGTHFPTGKQVTKDKAVVSICEKLLLPNRRPGVPQFLAGDFNTRRGSPEYDVLLRSAGMTDAPVDDPRPFSSDSQNSWKKGKSKGALIDYVLINAGGTTSAITRLTIQRPTREFEGETVDLADHYGVIAHIVLKK